MIFITGDVHRNVDILKLLKLASATPTLTRADYVIVAGDFGCLWDGGVEDDKYIRKIAKLPFTILFVDGNHENHEVLNAYDVKMWKGGKVHFISENIIHLMRGQVYDIEYRKIFTMGGAHSIDKNRRVEHISWWRDELPTTAQYEEALSNLEVNGNEVDVIITHTAPTKFISKLGLDIKLDPVSTFLDTVFEKVTFTQWFFGHMHVDIEVEENITALYNDIVLLR